MKNILFVSFAPNHSSCARRLQDVQGAAFSVESYSTRVDKNSDTIFKRLIKLTYLPLFVSLLFSKADIIWLWGVDVCFIGSLAKLVRPKLTIVWDISDINPHLLGNSLKAKVLRQIERLLLSRANWLLLTSPEFHDKYYDSRVPENKICVIENYLSASLRETNSRPLPRLTPFKVVYTGIFRSEKLLRILREVAAELGTEVEFHLFGYCSATVDEKLLEDVATEPNVTVHGKYAMPDLADIHAECHLIFGLLDEDADLNERWLLPNRIYQAGAFQRPILANRKTFTGQTVLARHLGTVCDFSVIDVAASIRKMTIRNGEYYHQLLQAIPSDGEYFLDGHYRRFIERALAETEGPGRTQVRTT
ncbi:hypothetical protein [Bradyrhizobium genomosp. III]|uniref:hypothetical protein n=1 Tax=Bradyrhizobium genomosp. III TaxID=2683271 RepID=UPI0005780132|nr:hypothetical protein [Bradyrhizobium sp. CCBAU 15635]